MKTPSTLLIAFVLCITSLDLSAYNGLKPCSLSDNNSGFMLKPKSGDSDDGVKDKIMITAGIGLNFFGTSLQLRYFGNPYENDVSGHQTSPMFNAAVDYGLGKKVSIGVAFGYQTARINMQDVIVTGDNYHDSWTRIHFAVRGDYYIVANENVNLYTGAKLGYNIYSVTTNLPPSLYPDYAQNLSIYPNPVSVQAHFGFSYFVNGMVGLNAEFGLGYGGPYMFAAGATIKI